MMIISFLGQKGEPTKSTFARAVATALVDSNWSVHIVDFDFQQQTSMKWAIRREELSKLNQIHVSVHRHIKEALKHADDKDATVMAVKSDLVVLPVGTSQTDSLNAVETIKEWGFDVSENTIPFKAGYIAAMDQGRSIIETRFKSLNENALAAVTDIANVAIKLRNKK